MVIGYVGRCGSGKTYSAVRYGLEQMRRGRQVVANFRLRGARVVRSFDELHTIGNCVVILDELNLWCPSRLWQQAGFSILSYFAQHRKAGIELVWTAQHESRVDTVIRELSDHIWRCWLLGGRVIVQRGVDAVTGDLIGRRLLWLNSRFFEYYNTYELVGNVKGEGRGLGLAAGVARPTDLSPVMVPGRVQGQGVDVEASWVRCVRLSASAAMGSGLPLPGAVDGSPGPARGQQGQV